jgi:hypothetical protein
MKRILLFIVILMSLVSIGLAMYGKGNRAQLSSGQTGGQGPIPERTHSSVYR